MPPADVKVRAGPKPGGRAEALPHEVVPRSVDLRNYRVPVRLGGAVVTGLLSHGEEVIALPETVEQPDVAGPPEQPK